jgi:acarbose 7IV-phosphotransferase
MATILVSGLINIETTLRIDGFPLEYRPVGYPFHGIETTVSGVGYNVARALTTLGHDVRLLSLIGSDAAGTLVEAALAEAALDASYVRATLAATAQSVILYDGGGRRAIFTDLKDIQEQCYPPDLFTAALAGADIAVLCNINFSRPFLQQAQDAGVLIATDVHAISDLDDAYNKAFMAAAEILFMSDERLPCRPEEWARRVQARYQTPIIVIGMGAAGALLAVREDGVVTHVPAVQTRPVVNTIGAGDALLSAFLHGYLPARDPYEALRRAAVFASYKIGSKGGADGFLTAPALEALYERFRR